MAETQVIDEVVSERAPAARGSLAARPVINETVEASTGNVKVARSGVEEDSVSEGGRKGRVLKASTEKILAELDKPIARAPAPHEVGDADEDEPADDADQDADVPADEDDTDDGDAAGDAAADGDAEVEDDASPDETVEIRATATRLEQRNRELISELETARKTPKTKRSDRETALVAAEQAYIEEGTVPAMRKFLSVVVGAAPDSKEVDAELAGIYLDLTEREVGVPLDQNQRALRDNARTRLLLARDKREKTDAGKKTEPGNGADEVQYEQAAKYVDNLLTTKVENGSSIADECPMLMMLAQDFDGYKPSEALARAVRHEYMTGTLDPKGSEIDAIRTVAQKMEKHYDAVAEKIEAARAKKTKPDTTKPSGKTPKAATEPSQEQRQSQGARTIRNATASRAPAKNPQMTKPKAPTTAEKTRKDFPSDVAWKEHLLSKHFKS